MTVTFDTSSGPRRRSQSETIPVRVRATITIDIDAEDYQGAERAKATIAAEYDTLRLACANATLEFRQRKPRSHPRPRAPSLVLPPYLDD